MKGKKIKWWIVALAAGLALAGIAALLYVFLSISGPRSLFEPSTLDTSHVQRPDASSAAGPGEAGESSPQPAVLNGIVNIMIMGIDAYENGGTTSGTEPHADVCMVLAVNFDTNEVNLVSLPRDMFTTTPGYYGYYKLNSVFNVGGGLDDPDGGFRQVCRTAEQLMGGVSIPYYYAVDFQAVVDLADAIGGIDFEVDTPFHTLSGAYYKKGLQHLDGDGVLGYLRIRKEADGLDSSRTERQRKMLVALFQKLKEEKKIASLLSVVGDVYDDVYTNTTLTQTMALLNYAAKIGPENIKTRIMVSPYSANYVWLAAFVDQQARKELIKDIYGFDVKPIAVCTAAYESWTHDICFSLMKTLHQTEKLLTYYEEQQAAGADYSQEIQTLYTECVEAHTALLETYQDADAAIRAVLERPEAASNDVLSVRNEYHDTLFSLRDACQKAAKSLAGQCGYPNSLVWRVADVSWGWDPDINEVPVDFN